MEYRMQGIYLQPHTPFCLFVVLKYASRENISIPITATPVGLDTGAFASISHVAFSEEPFAYLRLNKKSALLLHRKGFVAVLSSRDEWRE